MIVLHLRQIAIAPLYRGGGPLKGLGMFGRPRFPARSNLWSQLCGEGMRLKCRLCRLKCLNHFGGFCPTPRKGVLTR
jgi:hypothetical protein